MIDRLFGAKLEDTDTGCVWRAGDVGYNLLCTPTTAAALGSAGSVLVYPVYAEDAQRLIAFADAADRALFGALISVPGIGPVKALSILARGKPVDLQAAIASGNVQALKPFASAKTSEILISYLRDKVAKSAGITLVAGATDAAGDAVLALVALGYAKTDAQARVKGVSGTVQQIITAALRKPRQV